MCICSSFHPIFLWHKERKTNFFHSFTWFLSRFLSIQYPVLEPCVRLMSTHIHLLVVHLSWSTSLLFHS
jgi:hypothetical protein